MPVAAIIQKAANKNGFSQTLNAFIVQSLISPKIKNVFFDLDHTLWDFEQNSRKMLNILYVEFGLGQILRRTAMDFVNAFEAELPKLWDAYNKGTLDKQTLRAVRFPRIFKALGAAESSVPLGLEQAYFTRCPQQGIVFPGVHEALARLKQKGLRLHVLTNGFLESQRSKLVASRIDSFFETLTTSECAKARKPSPEMFYFALARANAEASTSLMVGDNLSTDIEGGRAVGMETLFFCPHGTINSSYGKHFSAFSELL